MINFLLKKLDKLTMSKGRFFSDKSYKYDTIFFVTKYLYPYINDNRLIIDSTAQNQIVENIVAAFNLPKDQVDSNKNYLLETLGFLSYTGVIEKVSATTYNVLDLSQLDFITVSIENAYIYQYLVAYQTFVNDGLWNLYLNYLSSNIKSEKEALLLDIKNVMCNIAASIGDPNSVWASNVVKFAVMVLGLANSDNAVTRNLNVKDTKIEPKDLSANVEGTRSTSAKDNFYIHDFRISYVKDYLSDTKHTVLVNKINIDESSRLKGGQNIILYGVPGAGKSFTLENDYKDSNTEMKRVVFHPDYTYSDFVGQILPLSKDGDVRYDFIPGPFASIVKQAYENPTQKYILAIEEINRGNAPAIFGDIFQLLDRDQDGKSKYTIANKDVAKIVFNNENKEIYIPSNLYLICTMNTSDQNVFTLDTAFQRRWHMRLIENEFKEDTEEEKRFANHPILDTDVSWKKFCKTINDQILDKNQNMTSSEDKRLGTHFVLEDDLTFDENEKSETATPDEKKTATLKNRRFPEKVIKYLWDDAFKFYRDEIFNPNHNSLEKIIAAFTGSTGNDRFNIFKETIKAAIVDKQN